jgi:hypothetical protein
MLITLAQIDQEGMTAHPLSGTNQGNNKVIKNLYWESVVPKLLAPRNHLVCHELLALHHTKSPQFYADFAQSMLPILVRTGWSADQYPAEITGSGSAQPSGDYLANIPENACKCHMHGIEGEPVAYVSLVL